MQPDTVENFFKLLQLIAASNPMELSYSSIGEALSKDKMWVMRFLAQVEKTEAIKRVYACGIGGETGSDRLNGDPQSLGAARAGMKS